MKTITVQINTTGDIPNDKKYAGYRGCKFEVTEQVDNFGDRTVTWDVGQPFMFININHCTPLLNRR